MAFVRRKMSENEYRVSDVVFVHIVTFFCFIIELIYVGFNLGRRKLRLALTWIEDFS